jgi:hypothetical protein
MMNPLEPFMGELEFREVRLVDTIDRLEHEEIDHVHAAVLEGEIDELYSEMIDLEERLDGLHAVLVQAADLATGDFPFAR